MSFSEDAGFEEPVIEDTRNLRRRIEKEFKQDISFKAVSKYLLVYASDITLGIIQLQVFTDVG